MGKAAMQAPDAPQLREHPNLQFQLGSYTYELQTDAHQSVLDIKNGAEEISRSLGWAFGIGDFGQTYVFENDGSFYESHVSYYTRLGRLDITTGHDRALPTSLPEAAGKLMSPEGSRECFGCHMTAVLVAGKLDPQNATPGVTCEACHGPGRSHVAAENASLPGAETLIMNPRNLSPEDSLDFCGSCHRTFGDAVMNGWTSIGVANARFQPYRLSESKCWGNGDSRLRCQSCHDPHRPPETTASSYDVYCLKCHVNGPGAKPNGHFSGRACTVATRECATCHMPKIELPGAHTAFTDHWIRIVRAGEPYPQ